MALADSLRQSQRPGQLAVEEEQADARHEAAHHRRRQQLLANRPTHSMPSTICKSPQRKVATTMPAMPWR